MNVDKKFSIRVLGPDDVSLMEKLMTIFGKAFDELDTYTKQKPNRAYLRSLLGRDTFITIAAVIDGEPVGGLTAYQLHKYEQERSEIYLYDLAVAEEFRRQGIAVSLISELRKIASKRGAYVVFVQADAGDEAAIDLYSKLGKREEVFHFDINVK
jgi:aminoglycoside 3-N-acetyltransferase I